MKILFSKAAPATPSALVFFVEPGGDLPESAKPFDKKAGGLISQALKNAPAFTGESGQILSIPLPAGAGAGRALLIGIGEAGKLTAAGAELLGGKLAAPLTSAGMKEAAIFVPRVEKGASADSPELAARLAAGFRLQSYKFDKYKTPDPKKKGEAGTEKLVFVLEDAAKADKFWKDLGLAVEGTLYARDLVNEPPNVIYPDAFAKRVKEDLTPLGVGVEILDEKKLKSMGLNAMLAVGQASAHPPRLVVLRWQGVKSAGAGKKGAGRGPLAFVGKGLTFDTGGLNLKPTGGIETMKLDMAGAAAVAGLFRTLALRKAKVDAVGILGIVENGISGTSYRPSDIVKGLSGKTIEILNTDAEGRVVLSDCLTYVQKTHSPRLVIDLATLTGAIMIALGNEYCGTFCNTDALWDELAEAGAQTGEKLWRMPLDPQWRKDCESALADIKNTGAPGRLAGACAGAAFLEFFIEQETAWAHLDIAGTAWLDSDKPNRPKGGTGFGVRLLDRFTALHYEK